jgi:hypothetical protein
VDFVLRYKGPVPGKKNDTVDDKQIVRMRFSPQLEQLCKRVEFFSDALRPDLLVGEVKQRALTFARPEGEDDPRARYMYRRLPLAGFDFVPVIARHQLMYCHLDITWLRTESAGDIVTSGDIDNRLKVLLDALRMPHEEKEVGRERPTVDGQRVYCLLDDDGLVTKLSVSTHQLLEPRAPDEKDTDADLLVHVWVKRKMGTWGNLSLPD